MKQFTVIADRILGVYASRIDREIIRYLDYNRSSNMYDMMRYFMGYADENGKQLSRSAGKRFRSGVALFIAEAYGNIHVIMPATLSLELFHNFTLIHDDIEDKDEMRRGRPTVWKLWGINQAINAGDAQLLLALEIVFKEQHIHRDSIIFLIDAYKQVIEGQHQDILLADLPFGDSRITEEYYFDMIIKKTAVLIAAACALPAVAAEKKYDSDILWRYGLCIGKLYQLADDFASLWNEEKETGKRMFGDIAEKKKTLPVIRLFHMLPPDKQRDLTELYALPRALTEKEVCRIVDMFQDYPVVQISVEEDMENIKKEAVIYAEQLPVPIEVRKSFCELTMSIGK